MKRWVNDYKLAAQVYQGYRPVIPFESKDVGQGVTAILMEMPDADYKENFELKQIKNDINSPGGGLDLTRYVNQEFSVKISSLPAFWFLKCFIGKLFNRNYQPVFKAKMKGF